MIEVEMRTFLEENKYKELLKFFEENGQDKKEEKQITYYFNCGQDFRLMLTNSYCQLWLKKGELHDDAREELVVKTDINYKDDLINMLITLGYGIEIKWYRIRNSFKWQNINVTIDYTYGYGYIIELEELIEDEIELEKIKEKFKQLFEKLNVSIVDKTIFKEKYEDYKNNWRKYILNINENEYLI